MAFPSFSRLYPQRDLSSLADISWDSVAETSSIPHQKLCGLDRIPPFSFLHCFVLPHHQQGVYRITEWLREAESDLWRLSSPIFLLKEASATASCPEGWRLHKLSRQLVPVFVHPDSKKVFAYVQIVLYFNLIPLPLVQSHATTKKSLAPSSLHPPIRYLYTLMRHCNPSLHFSSLSCPLTIFVALRSTCSSKSIPLLYWGTQRTALQICLHQLLCNRKCCFFVIPVRKALRLC